MATDFWKNGSDATWDTGSSWSDGAPPQPGDTAVISAAGDAAPTDQSFGDFPNLLAAHGTFAPGTGDPSPALTDDDIVPPPFIIQTILGSPIIYNLYYPDVAPGAQKIAGNTISGETIDLVGGGGLAVMQLQNTTLAADTTLNVSGSALLSNEFDSQLDGTIDIGQPFSIDGSTVQAPAANLNGYSSELDLLSNAAGFWSLNTSTLTYSEAGYVPVPENNGTINIGASSAFVVQLRGYPEDQIPITPPGLTKTQEFVYQPPVVSDFINTGTINVGPGGSAVFQDATQDLTTALYGDEVVNTGTINVTGASGATTTMTSTAPIIGGTLNVDGGSAASASDTAANLENFTSGLNISLANASLSLVLRTSNGAALAGQFSGGSITFDDDKSTLLVGPPTQTVPDEFYTSVGAITTPIYDFRAGDQIVIPFVFDAGPIDNNGDASFQALWNQQTHNLQIQETVTSVIGGPTQQGIVADFTLEGTYDPSSFSATTPDSSFTDTVRVVTITTTTTDPNSGAPCFVAGTLIATPRGERPVEALRAGDAVLVIDDHETRPATVRWVGHRRVDGAAHPEHAPVRIRAGALGPATPRRDLCVSPDHALLIDGVLVPAELLIDGATILRDHARSVTYHHVELEQHAVLLAEGAPAETYLDTGNRARFANCPLSYDAIEAAANDPCAEMVFAGSRLDAIRAALRGLHATV